MELGLLVNQILSNPRYFIVTVSFIIACILLLTNLISFFIRKDPSLFFGLNFPFGLFVSTGVNLYLMLVKLNYFHSSYLDRYSDNFVTFQSASLLLTWTGLVLYNVEFNKALKSVMLTINSILLIVYLELKIDYRTLKPITKLFTDTLSLFRIDGTQLVIYWFILTSGIGLVSSIFLFKDSQKSSYYLFRIKMFVLSTLLLLYRFVNIAGITITLHVNPNATLERVILPNLMINSRITNFDCSFAFFIDLLSFMFFSPPHWIYLRYKKNESSQEEEKNQK